MKENYSGKEYFFKMGEIADEMVEECRALVKEYYKNLVEDDEINKNTIGYQIGIGEKDISDELLFETAISCYKENIKNKIKERNRHIILVRRDK